MTNSQRHAAENAGFLTGVLNALTFGIFDHWIGATGTLTAGLAGLLLFAPTSFWQRNETATLGAEDLSIEGRLEAWQVAARVLRERPVLGVGAGAFLAAWNEYAPIDSDRLFGYRYVAHNLVLEALGQLGLLGVISLMSFVAICLFSAWRARHGELGGEARAVLASMAVEPGAAATATRRKLALARSCNCLQVLSCPHRYASTSRGHEVPQAMSAAPAQAFISAQPARSASSAPASRAAPQAAASWRRTSCSKAARSPRLTASISASSQGA